MPVVISGSASPRLSRLLAEELKLKLLKPEVRKFPDGETYVRLPEKPDEAIIVQSLSPPQNEHLVELLLTINACEEFGCKRITAVVPYLAYSRQDRRFLSGEPISAKVMARILKIVNKVVVVDAHSREALSFFENAQEVRSFAHLGKKLIEMDLKNPLFISPDEGSLERVREAAEAAGVEYECLKKKRIDSRKVRIERSKLHVGGRDVVILDDIVSTGGTVVEACKLLKGARKIIVCCVHGLFLGDAVKRMRKAGVKVILSTDTVESRFSEITVAPLISRVL